jgi:hypothetical protein
MPLTISPYDLTSGLKDAIEVMSQYLTGHRDRDWFVPGTCKYFEEVGGTVPTSPISEKDLVALSAIVERCERIRSDPTSMTTRGLKQFAAAVDQVSKYLENEIGITLDDTVQPADALGSKCSDLATATTAIKNEYMQMKSVPYAIPGAAYCRPPAPNESYLDQTRDLDPNGRKDLDDIAGTKVDAQSEYWAPPEPTTWVEGTYGRVPDALFK